MIPKYWQMTLSLMVVKLFLTLKYAPFQCLIYNYYFCFSCGKTTQIPQFIVDSWLREGRGEQCFIICTQPRRISATSVAERVASERAEKLGEMVGYQIRLESRQVGVKPEN